VATITASASSGAAGGVSVAGSVALVIVDQDTTAAIDGTVILSGGDVTITAASAITTTATALPVGAGSASSGSVGIGVSFAFILLDDVVAALVADGVSLTGARDVVLEAGATTAATAEARMGAEAPGSSGGGSGRSSSGVALVPA